jgi:hypothetical protein
VDADGQPNGYGERTLTSKDSYEGTVHTGMWVHGLFQGVGKLVLPSGYQSSGQFVEGNSSGVALCEYPNGDRYSGEFKFGHKHGFGTFTFRDGSVVMGWYVEDKYHGVALFVAVDGSKSAWTCEHDKVVSRTSGLTVIPSEKHSFC